MKSYEFIINGKKYKTSVKSSSPGLRTVEVNGQVYEVVIEGEKEEMEARMSAIEKAAQESKVFVPVTGGGSKTMASGSANDVLSPIPGLIMEIMVKEGDKVSTGDLVIKMEAMKMENEIKSTRDGTVKKIHINKGDSVLEGQPLITVE
jgi:glutaconyl-CoA/methylmalonyl-CoA decarboxylase subunit gamma